MASEATREADILSLLPDAVVVVGEGPRIEYMNRAALSLVGCGPDWEGRRPGEVFILRDASSRRLDENLPLGCRTPMSRGIPEGQYDLTSAGRDRLPVSVMANYEKDDRGTVRRVFISIRSAKRRGGIDLRAHELIATLGHEMRQPLTSVKGFTQTLLKRWDLFDDDAKRDMLGEVLKDADRIHRMIEELLMLTRLESGVMTLQRQRFDLSELARKVAGRLQERSSSHRLVVDAPGSVDLLADPDKIEQVLTNLVENALNYTESGVVQIHVGSEDATVFVAVSDEGEGIPASQIPLIFRKGYRRQRVRSTRGTGLGLYISRRLMEAHDGQLTAVSEPGKGSTFTLRLPVGIPA